MSFDNGTYVRFKTLNHRISGPQMWGQESSGMYSLSGSEVLDLGILSNGANNSELEIRCRLNGTLAPLNATSELVGKDFSIPYYVFDSDTTLDEDTEFWFYIPPSYDITYDPLNGTSSYTSNPYSDQKYFLVSGGNDSYQPIPLEAVPEPATSRAMNARATWVYDTAMYNLVGTGRRWMGELFDFTTTRVYDFRERTAMTASTVNQPVPGTAVRVQIKAVARSSTNNTKLLVQYGSQSASVTFPAVQTGSVSNYVQEKFLTATFTADQSASITLSYDKAGNNAAAMWLDEMIVDWETSEEEVYPSQSMVNHPRGAGNYSHFNVEGTSCLRIFGIENRQISSLVEPAVVVSGGLDQYQWKWYSHEDKLRTYKIGYCTDPLAYIVDQKVDLGTIETAVLSDLDGIESIIIAPDSLLDAAQELAVLERSTGVSSEVVALSYIYDEMNTGNPDIGAIRKFLVKAYADYGTLKYLTLFGDASYDYKGKLQGRQSNLVPTYHTAASFSLYTSYITDDFYGYLDAGETLNWFLDDLDVGIGRIPVRNVQEAQEAVAKIGNYLQGADRFGPWRARGVFVVDDVDEAWEKEFAVVQDRLAKKLDTTRAELNQIKIYSDAYLQDTKPGSQRYPEARQALFNEVEQGALAVSFVGHGGEVGWTTERILQLEDINGWNNTSKQPVVTTITCEFTRFDDPLRISAGEQLFLNPNGGAIGLFSTTRSVFATNSTYALNALLNEEMMQLDNPRLGDVLRETKNNNNSGDKIKFSLIGDAALPLARPKHQMSFDTLNGMAWSDFQDTLKALSWVQIKGSVLDAQSGALMTGFNGKAWVTVFDKAQEQETKVNDQSGTPFRFTTQSNTVFKGQASVVNGRYSVEFRVPLDINLSYGPPKISAYATNYETDAWGASNDQLMGGIYDGLITDTEGPEVRLFMNDTTFTSGSSVESDATGLGLLYDESGINAVGLGIGHNMTLTLDGEAINVNDYYESDLDDFTRGSLRYPFNDLALGEHTLSLRAWDVLNQWGYDSIAFVVVEPSTPILDQLLAFPNPFTDQVKFQLTHQEQGEEGELKVSVTNNQGQLVWQRAQILRLNDAKTQLPTFTMSEQPGKTSGAGFYSVRVEWTRLIDGKSATIQEKLIYIR
jgi:hypothetical protein